MMPTARARDTGFTLVELLVSMTLLGVLSAITTAGIASAFKATRQDATRAFNAAALDTELQRIAREARVADPAQVVTASDMVVDVYRPDPSGLVRCQRLEWRMSGTTLQQRTLIWSSAVCPTYPSIGTPTTNTGYVARLSGITTASPFSYRDNAGSVLTSPTAATVRQVVVTVTQLQTENRASITTSATAYLRNTT